MAPPVCPRPVATAGPYFYHHCKISPKDPATPPCQLNRHQERSPVTAKSLKAHRVPHRPAAQPAPSNQQPAPSLATPPTKRKRTAHPSVGARTKSRAKVLDDDLGKKIALTAELFDTHGFRALIKTLQGRGDLAKATELSKCWHPAQRLLKQLQRHGVPVVATTSPWTMDMLVARIKRGSHKSCDDHLDFLRQELLDFSMKGFWFLLPFKLLKKKWKKKYENLKGLRVAPLGVIPQRDHRPRLIVDYTFYDLNKDTLFMAPYEAMQFGRALERVLYLVRHANPRFGPLFLNKVDLSDGFMRVKLNPSAVLKLGVAFPRYPGEEQMIAFPLVLPMGWVESPPYFCAVTETVCDVANAIPASATLKAHPLEHLANTPPPLDGHFVLVPSKTATCGQLASGESDSPTPKLVPSERASGLPVPRPSDVAASGPRALRQSDITLKTRELASGPPVLRPFHKPVRSHDIYLDDYLGAVQGRASTCLQHQRSLLHSLDSILRPVDADDHPSRKDVPSLSKFAKGDGYQCTRKGILGWIVDTVQQTLELPPHRIARLHDIFADLRGRDRVGLSQWHKYLGELRSMSIGIPGSKGLFSTLQEAFRHTDGQRIRITPTMRDQLADFEYLASELATRPTSLAELVPDHPVAVGPHDASGTGMGGVWFPATTNSNLTPILWRERFPNSISLALVSDKNPSGTINNSQLELAGQIAQQDVLVQHVDCQGRTVVPLGDNIPMVSWHHKGSTTTTGPTAYLLRLNSLHQRHFRYLAKADYIPGLVNAMADDCSRLWHLSDSQLVAYFNLTYPQTQPWQLVALRPAMNSAIVSALQMQRPTPASFLNEVTPKTVTGKSGLTSLPILPSTPTYAGTRKNPSYIFSKFSPIDSALAKLPPAADLLGSAQWRTTYGPSPRKSPSWMAPTPPATLPAS